MLSTGRRGCRRAGPCAPAPGRARAGARPAARAARPRAGAAAPRSASGRRWPGARSAAAVAGLREHARPPRRRPARAANSTWCARAAAGAPRAASAAPRARARRAASRRARSRRPRGARAGGGSGTAAARRWRGRGPASSSASNASMAASPRRPRRRWRRRPRTGRRPPRRPRAPLRRRGQQASSSASDASTAPGTPTPATGLRRGGRRRAGSTARELLEVERVAARLGVERVSTPRRRPRRAARPPPPATAPRARPVRAAVAVGALERGAQPLRELARARRRARAGPLRPAAAHQRDHRSTDAGSAQCTSSSTSTSGRAPPGARAARAPRGARGSARPAASRAGAARSDSAGSMWAISPSVSSLERRRAARIEPRDVLVERVDEDPERQVALELGRAAAEHEAPAGGRARLQLAQQPRLADARLALDQQRRRFPALERVERAVDGIQLGVAPDETLVDLRVIWPQGRA